MLVFKKCFVCLCSATRYKLIFVLLKDLLFFGQYYKTFLSVIYEFL
jgi:hypothetical protein